MDYHEHMKQYYDRLASEYEQNEAYREEPSEDLPGLFHAISVLPPARVLDVACGTGFVTQQIDAHSHRLTLPLGPGNEFALQGSELLLRIALRRFGGRELAHRDEGGAACQHVGERGGAGTALGPEEHQRGGLARAGRRRGRLRSRTRARSRS